MTHFRFCVRSACIALTSVLSVCVGAAPAFADIIVLSWDPNPEPDVAGYMLHVGTQSGWYTQTIDTGMATSYTWWGATAGQRYCFALSAYIAGYLEGPKSSEVCGYSDEHPVLANPGSLWSTPGQATDLQLQGSDPDGQPVSYTATGLPAGLSLMSSTGYIYGTPTDSGIYTVTATVSDGALTSSQTFTWVITESGTSSSATSGGGSSGSGGISGDSGAGLRGYYYSGLFATVLTTRVEAVNFDWGYGAPAWDVPADNFSVEWSGEIVAPATGTYYFSTLSDDGVRVMVGNQLLIDNWTNHGPVTDTSYGIWLQAGQSYPIRVDYYDAGGSAVIQLRWSYPGQSTEVVPPSALRSPGTAPSSTPSNTVSSNTVPSNTVPSNTVSSMPSGTGLSGNYYSGLFESFLTTRVEAVDFTWGYDAPAPDVPADYFSVQWTGQLVAPVTGYYTFATVSDDGVRLWVDNQWLIDNWVDHGTTTDTSRSIYLEAGQRYSVRVDFYDNGGGAVMQLLWAPPDRGYEVIPQSALTP